MQEGMNEFTLNDELDVAMGKHMGIFSRKLEGDFRAIM